MRLFFYLLGLFMLACSIQSAAAETDTWPMLTLSNGIIEADVALPDEENGYYRGSRFARAGIVTQVRYGDHTYFGELREDRDPLGNDHVAGTAGEFGMDTAYGFMRAGTNGLFLKIGVGMLRRNGEKYGFWHNYPVEIPSAIATEAGNDGRSVVFVETAPAEAPVHYELTTKVELLPDTPEMLLKYSLRNTGSVPIYHDHYTHNMVRIDNIRVGNAYRMIWQNDFNLPPKAAKSEKIQRNHNTLMFTEDVLSGGFHTLLEPVQPGISPFPVTCQLGENGAAVTITPHFNLSKTALYAEKNALCPEPFFFFTAEPGKTVEWHLTYAFKQEGNDSNDP